MQLEAGKAGRFIGLEKVVNQYGVHFRPMASQCPPDDDIGTECACGDCSQAKYKNKTPNTKQQPSQIQERDGLIGGVLCGGSAECSSTKKKAECARRSFHAKYSF